MSLHRIDCPYCGANIEIDSDNRKVLYCQYCGNQILLKNDTNDITINQNVSIYKNVNQRVTNDAEILREQNRHTESRWKLVFISVLVAFIIGGVAFFALSQSEKNNMAMTPATKDGDESTNTQFENNDNVENKGNDDSLNDDKENLNTGEETESQDKSDYDTFVDDPIIINEEVEFPVLLYEGDLGKYYLNSVIHYSNKEDSPIYKEGYFFEMEFENGSNVNAYCFLGNGYLNDYRILVYTDFAEKVVVAPGKKGVVTSNIRDEDITDSMKGFNKFECEFNIGDENEKELYSRQLIIDERTITYK